MKKIILLKKSKYFSQLSKKEIFSKQYFANL